MNWYFCRRKTWFEKKNIHMLTCIYYWGQYKKKIKVPVQYVLYLISYVSDDYSSECALCDAEIIAVVI